MTQEIPLHLIRRNPDQPRQHFDPVKLRELADSIALNGLAQPITVRPVPIDEDGTKFEIVMGERRWRAHMLLKEAGQKETVTANVREMDDQTMHVQAILENLQRVDVNPIEEAHAFQLAIAEYGYTEEALAKQLGINQPWLIPNRLKLLKLTPDNQDLMVRGIINKKQAAAMSDLSPNGQKKFLDLVKQGLVNTNKSCEEAAAQISADENQIALFQPKDTPERTCVEGKTVESQIDRIGKAISQMMGEDGFEICDDIQIGQAKRCMEKVKLLKLNLGQIERELQRAASRSALTPQ